MARRGNREIKKAIGRIQRLCCLGQGGQAAMPALLTVLQDIIPSSTQSFFWAGYRQQLSNMYYEGPGIVYAAHYLEEFHDRREREVVMTFTEAMRTRYRTPAADFVQRYAKVEKRSYLRSDYYNLIAKPAGQSKVIAVNVSDGGRPSGLLSLCRTDREPAFAPRDLMILNALHGFIAHAQSPGLAADGFADTDDRALVIVDRNERIMQLSPEAHRLLLMALMPEWTPWTARHMRLEKNPDIARLCRALSSACFDGLTRSPPVLRQRNAWGEFVLRAYWLGASDLAENSRLFGITIERREPRSVALLRKIETLDLSDREKELCLLLVRGHDAAHSAQAMNISEHTVITHRRSLYNKLGVQNRAALIERLRVE